MAQFAGKFFSAYLIKDHNRTIGCTVKGSVDNGNRVGKLIGFDIDPNPNDYYKVTDVVGDPTYDGMIIPDTGLFVSVDDFFRGSFVGDETRRDVCLRRMNTADRNERKVTIFSMERVSYTRSIPSTSNIEALKQLVGGGNWLPSTLKKNNNVSNDLRTPGSSTGATRKYSTEQSSPVGDGILESKNTPRKLGVVKRQVAASEQYVRLYGNDVVRYQEIKGDLFSVNHGIIMNCISADVHMGKAIAAEFARLFPKDKKELLAKPKLQVGTAHLCESGPAPIRCYLVTKEEYHQKPTLDSVVASLRRLQVYCLHMKVFQVYGLKIGAGLDKLKWEEVRNAICEHLAINDISCTVYLL